MQTDRKRTKEDKPEKWANGEPSPQHLLVFGQQPAPPSIALRKMEREERIGEEMSGKIRQTDTERLGYRYIKRWKRLEKHERKS